MAHLSSNTVRMKQVQVTDWRNDDILAVVRRWVSLSFSLLRLSLLAAVVAPR
jgi:hypothetical protein